MGSSFTRGSIPLRRARSFKSYSLARGTAQAARAPKPYFSAVLAAAFISSFYLCEHSIKQRCVVFHIGLVRVGPLPAVRRPLLVPSRAGRRRFFRGGFAFFFNYLDAPHRSAFRPPRRRSRRERFIFLLLLFLVGRSGARRALSRLPVPRTRRAPSPRRGGRRRLRRFLRERLLGRRRRRALFFL